MAYGIIRHRCRDDPSCVQHRDPEGERPTKRGCKGEIKTAGAARSNCREENLAGQAMHCHWCAPVPAPELPWSDEQCHDTAGDVQQQRHPSGPEWPKSCWIIVNEVAGRINKNKCNGDGGEDCPYGDCANSHAFTTYLFRQVAYRGAWHINLPSFHKNVPVLRRS